MHSIAMVANHEPSVKWCIHTRLPAHWCKLTGVWQSTCEQPIQAPLDGGGGGGSRTVRLRGFGRLCLPGPPPLQLCCGERPASACGAHVDCCPVSWSGRPAPGHRSRRHTSDCGAQRRHHHPPPLPITLRVAHLAIVPAQAMVQLTCSHCTRGCMVQGGPWKRTSGCGALPGAEACCPAHRVPAAGPSTARGPAAPSCPPRTGLPSAAACAAPPAQATFQGPRIRGGGLRHPARTAGAGCSSFDGRCWLSSSLAPLPYRAASGCSLRCLACACSIEWWQEARIAATAAALWCLPPMMGRQSTSACARGGVVRSLPVKL